MSHKQAIYDAYLENFRQHHPNVVEPEYLSGSDADNLVIDAGKNGTKLTHSTKAIEGSTVPVGAFLMPDGRVIEVATTENHFFNVVAVHASRENYERYARPMSMNMYWNG